MTARDQLDRFITEAAFQASIVELAELTGHLVWHDNDSRRNAAGWPDLVIAKPGQMLHIWEVKTERGQLRPEQRQWLDVLMQCTGLDVRLVRPRNWEEIEATLKKGVGR